MSEYQNTHDEDIPRFEPWLGMIAASVLPIGAAIKFPDAFPFLMVVTVLLFVGGLVMLRMQNVRRARERNRKHAIERPVVQSTPLAASAQFQSEDR